MKTLTSYLTSQNSRKKKNLRNVDRDRNSATGYDNNLFIQKNNKWICSLCYDEVTPKHFEIINDENGLPSIDKSKKILWVNKNTSVPHRKQTMKGYGHNKYVYNCIMAHFEKLKEDKYPVDDNSCCEICKTKVIETFHPVYQSKKIIVNLKDSKSHFRRYNLKWVCII